MMKGRAPKHVSVVKHVGFRAIFKEFISPWFRMVREANFYVSKAEKHYKRQRLELPEV
jgi:hypothetical protein